MVLHQALTLLDPFLFHVAIMIFALIILFYAADLIVLGISNYARKLGLSDYLIGLVVVAMAASMPEIVSAIIGLSLNEPSVMFGTILGSNMVHMALLTGILVFIGKRLNLECQILEKSKVILWFMLLLPFVLALDGELSRPDGFILVVAFVFYIILLWRQEGRLGKIKKNVQLKTIWRDMFIFVGSLVALLLAGRWLVFSGVQIAHLLDIPTYFVALTILGIGGAIPDLAVELRALFRGHQAIGVGDALGSTVIEFLLFFGIVAMIMPLQVDLASIANAAFWLLASITVMLYYIHKKVITRKHGLVLLLFYAAFLAIEIWKIV